ncbi:MAG: hypothetical protein Kow0056_02590 [Coriobacteriia bacterium]
MTVRIRLARAGAKKKPFYRVVVADKRAPRDGRFIEIVGRYNPRTNPSLVELDLDKINEWISKGATPSETVQKLIDIASNPDAPAPETAKDRRPSAKAQAAMSAKEKAAAEAAEAEATDESDAPEPEAADEGEPAEAEAARETEAAAESEEAPEESGSDEEPEAE